ncbi:MULTISPECIES: hypothetical protein [Rhizobium]|uniref:Uncharacterized protein n=1 Tax=Rhizobium esperanzae TaxID=1967781 RepID=A0A7W6XWJ0_9HYPH|nr:MULTISPECIES: hypothetical protein [Rhizobium]MBB4441563.1 hypothetical protein [Rhizobium esperanzae]MBY5376248.1 hypothetical protein [Rhizobium leguminosarum]MBY5421087.1 hypothetical protein [Rhizobium leguminosarum]MDH6202671.1 hypothetical protein [Rhizobium leguminosarum]
MLFYAQSDRYTPNIERLVSPIRPQCLATCLTLPGEGEKANAIRNAGDKVLNIDNVRNGGRRQRGDQEFTAAIER